MEAPAAVAHEQPARRRGKQISERIDPILQRHGASNHRLKAISCFRMAGDHISKML
jgi:hypothetical protein